MNETSTVCSAAYRECVAGVNAWQGRKENTLGSGCLNELFSVERDGYARNSVRSDSLFKERFREARSKHRWYREKNALCTLSVAECVFVMSRVKRGRSDARLFGDEKRC